MARFLAIALVLCACDAHLGPPNSGSDAGRSDSGGGGAEPAVDAPLGPWSAGVSVPGADLAGVNQDDVALNSTMTELYFKKPGAAGDNDLFWMTRATPADAWGPATLLAQVSSSPGTDESPRLSPDDLTLYFGHAGDIYMSTRASTAVPWGAPSLLSEVNTGTYEKWLSVCQGGYFIVSRGVSRGATSDQDLFVGKLDGQDIGTLSAELSVAMANETSTFLSADCLTVFFASNRSGVAQIYTATRPDPASPFSAPVLYEMFGTSTSDEDPWESPDQRSFYFASVRNGSATKAVYVSMR
jgi:hypothetical protein